MRNSRISWYALLLKMPPFGEQLPPVRSMGKAMERSHDSCTGWLISQSLVATIQIISIGMC
jgi:hypothetical protein